jgi:hypothetical protein
MTEPEIFQKAFSDELIAAVKGLIARSIASEREAARKHFTELETELLSLVAGLEARVAKMEESFR